MNNDVRQQAINLYDRYTHEGMDRRVFMADMARIAGSVAAAELLAHAAGIAAALAALPPASVRLTKRLMKQSGAAEVEKRIVEESEIFRERLKSPEAQEAFTAFLEKRKPDFSRF